MIWCIGKHFNNSSCCFCQQLYHQYLQVSQFHWQQYMALSWHYHHCGFWWCISDGAWGALFFSDHSYTSSSLSHLFLFIMWRPKTGYMSWDRNWWKQVPTSAYSIVYSFLPCGTVGERQEFPRISFIFLNGNFSKKSHRLPMTYTISSIPEKCWAKQFWRFLLNVMQQVNNERSFVKFQHATWLLWSFNRNRLAGCHPCSYCGWDNPHMYHPLKCNYSSCLALFCIQLFGNCNYCYWEALILAPPGYCCISWVDLMVWLILWSLMYFIHILCFNNLHRKAKLFIEILLWQRHSLCRLIGFRYRHA